MQSRSLKLNWVKDKIPIRYCASSYRAEYKGTIFEIASMINNDKINWSFAYLTPIEQYNSKPYDHDFEYDSFDEVKDAAESVAIECGID
jgi:hypothetical protein